MVHDFVKFPELANRQMAVYYFESPHKQITEDFRAKVVKVVDGDTIRVMMDERDFDFPVRLLDINAPEMNEPRGREVRDWLANLILNEEVDIKIDRNRRVGKWGRLLGKVFHRGMDLGEMMMSMGKVTSFEGRKEGMLPDLNKELRVRW